MNIFEKNPIHVASIGEMEQLAQKLAPMLREGGAVFFQGPLGVGKTTFVRLICQALGVTRPVTSPSFDLLHIYETETLMIYHVDGYRLREVSEWDVLDLPADLTGTLLLAEWAEAILADYPERLEVTLAFGPERSHERLVTLTFVGSRWTTGRQVRGGRDDGF
ncbi:MAG: tRNA (adenosine(37)-N6)-threonylcarbamoyltransferase complex ATPase subunit type 1 TsaE [Firmicutes bacterium]|nr:tRNA (adenosine(37)-N6)-threonylcarbamoyltransferase complex ATPase subunit type 1 TsaE [Bacillota bacterium]